MFKKNLLSTYPLLISYSWKYEKEKNPQSKQYSISTQQILFIAKRILKILELILCMQFDLFK